MSAYSQDTTPFDKPSTEWVTVTHPHHPLCGQRVEVIRVRRGPDFDLIIRMVDGYHGAISAHWTDYAPPSDGASIPESPPLLALDGLWNIARFVEQRRKHPLLEDNEI